jgi:flagellar hook-associated protein 2
VQTCTKQEKISNQIAKLGSTNVADWSISIPGGNPLKETKIPIRDYKTSLLEMRDAINNAKAGVTASIPCARGRQ